MSNNLIYELVLSLYKKNHIVTFPINCQEIISQEGFSLYTYTELHQKNPYLYQMCRLYSDDAFTYGNIIAYNSNKPLGRIRFSLMHEFSHYLLNHTIESEEFEKQADILASNILAPRIIIHKNHCKTADKIHDFFGLSYAASNRALLDYKKWYDNISMTTKSPSWPEKQLEQLFFPGKCSATSTLEQHSQPKESNVGYGFFEKLHNIRGDLDLLDCQQWYYTSNL